MTGAAQDGGAHAKGMAGQEHAGDEASHGVTEDHVRDAAHPHVAALRQALEGELAQRLHIGDEHVLADLEWHVTQVLGARDALAMTYMVVRADGETLLAKDPTA